jgi:phosphopentomutase
VDVVEKVQAASEEMATDTKCDIAVIEEEEPCMEEEPMEELPTEEAQPEEVAMAIDPQADSEAILAIVQPVLDALATELMKAIADVKALIPVTEADGTEEIAASEQKYTAIDRLKSYRKLFKEN